MSIIKQDLTFWNEAALATFGATPGGAYRFTNFYHPYVCLFLRTVRLDGILALLDPASGDDAEEPDLFRQQKSNWQATETDKEFYTNLSPDDENVLQPYPYEEIDFESDGAYSQYNWEVFFHLPFHVASRLMDAGHHDDAMKWFHTIFDPRTQEELPSDAPDTAKWWKIKPFLEDVTAPVTQWADFIGESGSEERAIFDAQVAAWEEEPFDPHVIARLRPGTYQKAVVMLYLDNLIAWGDKLFTRDTIETINEATQLYVFAAQILGDRPHELAPATKPTARTYAQLKALAADDWDAFGNVQLENYAAADPSAGTALDLTVPLPWGGRLGRSSSGGAATAGISDFYFCVPQNPKLLSYWDTVEDRLFKIRNGMNIEGVVRSLPLFEPPIDPALLVRAAAGGVDIGTVLDDLSVSQPHYRFTTMVQRAIQLAGSVRSLGAALLSALEKKDAEELALLRNDHEEKLLSEVTYVREHQVSEAKTSLAAARQAKVLADARRAYYKGLLDDGWSSAETQATDLMELAEIFDFNAAIVHSLAAVFGYFPSVLVPPGTMVEVLGSQLHRGTSSAASALASYSGICRGMAGRLTTTAGYDRREAEWKHQQGLAELEVEQHSQLIAAAELRVEIAERESRNHQLQIEHVTQLGEWMRSKYTNKDLYHWMAGQLAALHFQTYQLALGMAKKAQACYRHELGRADDTFIEAVYWDSLRKGVLAGDRLVADLERMDAAYLEHDRREFELTRAFSLHAMDSLALARLRETGECYFEIPEAVFDLDCPGHYFRRISSVAVSIPCVSGPNAPVQAQLTLHAAKLRRTASVSTAADDEVLASYPSIVTSTAVDDAGVFNADLRDPRYLPFERRGAISTWHLRLTAQTIAQFDWDSITDVILRMRYTARDGGAAFRDVVQANLAAGLAGMSIGYTGGPGAWASSASGLVQPFGMKRDFPDEWYVAQTSGTLEVDGLQYPHHASQWSKRSVSEIWFLFKGGSVPSPTNGQGTTVTIDGTAYPGSSSGSPLLWETDTVTGLVVLKCAPGTSLTSLPTSIRYESTQFDLTSTSIEDAAILVFYGVS